jgi:Domain of unknown function (DUF4918)
MTIANKILAYNKQLNLAEKLLMGIGVMNPFKDEYVFHLCERFYKKYYSDDKKRTLILGINPGRYGAGLTGIPFTDSVKLANFCNIENTLAKKTELSADFIYEIIFAFGGIKKFYRQFYFNSVCPLGFVKDGKNLNYYDDKKLEAIVKPFAVKCMKKQIDFNINTDICYCLGEGKNFSFLKTLNEEYKFFKKIIPLPHPRFIMQYKRKRKDEYIINYLEAFKIRDNL